MLLLVYHCSDQDKLKRMHTAVKLNEAIRMQSSSADLVIVNFPTPPERYDGQHCCILSKDIVTSLSMHIRLHVNMLVSKCILKEISSTVRYA